MASANDFDIWLHTWDIHNRRKKVRSLYDDPEKNQEAEWEEFSAVCGWGTKYCDGLVMVDHYEGMYSGQVTRGLNVRAYNPETGEWSIVWLSNRQPPDFDPMVGRFENGVGTFYGSIVTGDGRKVLVRFVLEKLSEDALHWEQAFSMDGGEHWEANWIMESTRRK